MMNGGITRFLFVIFCFALIFTTGCAEEYKNTKDKPTESFLEASAKIHNEASIIASVEGYTEEDGMAVVEIMRFLEKRGDISNSKIVFAEDRHSTYIDELGIERQGTELYVQTEDGEGYYLLVDYGTVYGVYHGGLEQSNLIWYIIL